MSSDPRALDAARNIVTTLSTEDQIHLASHCIEVVSQAKANGHYAPVLAETALNAMTDADREAFLARYAAANQARKRSCCAS
jgi:hypothetical protein